MTFSVGAFPGREIMHKHKKYLYFGGTAYLGLQTDEEFQEYYISNIKKYGTNYGASRKSNIQITIYEEAEIYLSNLVGSEACLTLSSGFLAGQLVAQTMQDMKYSLFYAPNTHAALYTSATIPTTKLKPYISFTALNIALREHLENNKKNTPVVFLDAIDFSGSNYPHFEGLKMLPLDKLILVVDDSHGIGILGNNGGGVFRMIQELKPKELIVCCSLGKGFGLQAGAIFGSKDRIRNYTSTSLFGGASPPTPATIACLIKGEKLFKKKRNILKQNIDLFISNTNALNRFVYMESHPSFSYNNEGLTHYLQEKNILATSFRYPNKNSPLMSRIVISAHHKKEDILLLCSTINTYFNPPYS